MQNNTSKNEQLFSSLKSINKFELNLSNPFGLSNDELLNTINLSKSVLHKYSKVNNTQSTTLIYVTNIQQYDRLRELLYLTGDTEQSTIDILGDDYAQLSLLFPNVNSILIPKKAEYNLKKYTPKPLLYSIDSDINVAIQKCLVFLNNLASTHYEDNRWKPLHSTILHEQLKNEGDNTYVYKQVIEALKFGTKQTGGIILPKKCPHGFETYQVGGKSKQYMLTDTYFKAGLTEYIIKDEAIIQNRNKAFYKALSEANDNVISNNLLKLYPNIEIPTVDAVLAEGKRLVKSNYITKSQKKLTMRNRHPNNYWKDAKQRSFVEDNIELYQFLTGRGFMIPNAGKHTNGGRVVDSFNLMPSWIRNMVKINGEPIVECDFTAMHPNLANSLYCGSGQHISHQEVADYLGMDRKQAKKEHLSFFNKPYYPSKNKKEAEKGAMVTSSIHKYYEDNEPIMLGNIKNDKLGNNYKSSTYKLFGLEVEVMTEVISRLNDLGIYVMYVYDALYCAESNYDTVAYTMNQVVKDMSINTRVA